MLPKPKDYEAMSNPELLDFAKQRRITVRPGLHNELTVIRGVTVDPKADAARDKIIALLRSADDRSTATRAQLLSLIGVAIAAVALVVSLLKHR